MEIAQVALSEKSRRTDAISGDEEMAAPAARLEEVRDRMMKAHAAIVEGKEHGGVFSFHERW